MEYLDEAINKINEFKSGREMARHFKIDGKKARAAIAEGNYNYYIIIAKEVSYRKEIFVFNKKKELICKFYSITEAI